MQESLLINAQVLDAGPDNPLNHDEWIEKWVSQGLINSHLSSDQLKSYCNYLRSVGFDSYDTARHLRESDLQSDSPIKLGHLRVLIECLDKYR